MSSNTWGLLRKRWGGGGGGGDGHLFWIVLLVGVIRSKDSQQLWFFGVRFFCGFFFVVFKWIIAAASFFCYLVSCIKMDHC